MARTTAIYMDYNATAPLRPPVREAMLGALAVVGNPSSVHRFGREARRLVEDAREAVVRLIGAAPSDIVFTSGGTEANALALAGARRPGMRLLVSAIEHDSVLSAAGDAEVLPVGPDGVIDLDALDAMLAAGEGRAALISIMLANNETGVVQPLQKVASIAARHGALLHCDAVQAAGRLPLDARALGVRLLTLSAHKLGGPQGVGALYADPGIDLAALIRGGGQERGRRAGTENVAGIAGFGAAASLAAEDLVAAPSGLSRLRDALEAGLRSIAPHARIFGLGADRLANTSCVAMPGVGSETQVMAFDLAGIAVSAGAACSSGKVRASHVLRAMGVPEEEARTAIRVSLGWNSTGSDIERFLDAWARLYARAGARAA